MNRFFTQTFTLAALHLLFFAVPCRSDEAASPLTFAELDHYTGSESATFSKLDGSTVQITGFLYMTGEAGMVLSSEPNLKSCCVGSRAKRFRQIAVSGEKIVGISSGRAVAVKGILHIRPESDPVYHLSEAAIVERTESGVPGLITGSLLLLLGCGTGYVWIAKGSKPKKTQK